jgi:protein subunit release factor B
VKDHETGHESSNPDAVLAGDLDGFIDAALNPESSADETGQAEAG